MVAGPRRRLIALATATAVLWGGGCAGTEPSSSELPTLSTTALSTTAPSTPPPTAQPLLEAVVAEIEALFGGRLGIATVDAAEPVTAGFIAPSPAWSTIKVPIAIAALRADPALARYAKVAITISDNMAAELLYDVAGPDAVDRVLAEAGVTTAVNQVRLRPEFSTFGQTALSVADEAQLASSLACVDGAEPVIASMERISLGQAYGLGAVPGAAFKGGWGPDEIGMYQVRQFGLVPRSDGAFVPLALTALPADGTYETGQAMLTQAVLALAEQLDALPAAACQPN